MFLTGTLHFAGSPYAEQGLKRVTPAPADSETTPGTTRGQHSAACTAGANRRVKPNRLGHGTLRFRSANVPVLRRGPLRGTRNPCSRVIPSGYNVRRRIPRTQSRANNPHQKSVHSTVPIPAACNGIATLLISNRGAAGPPAPRFCNSTTWVRTPTGATGCRARGSAGWHCPAGPGRRPPPGW